MTEKGGSTLWICNDGFGLHLLLLYSTTLAQFEQAVRNDPQTTAYSEDKISVGEEIFF